MRALLSLILPIVSLVVLAQLQEPEKPDNEAAEVSEDRWRDEVRISITHAYVDGATDAAETIDAFHRSSKSGMSRNRAAWLAIEYLGRAVEGPKRDELAHALAVEGERDE